MHRFAKLPAALLLGAWLSLGGLMAFDDPDLDGVPSHLDRCPGTSMDEMVDASGCPKRLGLSLGFGAGYSMGDYGGSDTIISQSADLRLGFHKGAWYASVSTSYLDSGVQDPAVDLNSSSGQGDTYLLGGYALSGKKWNLMLQLLVKLPTADTDIGTGETDVGGYATLSVMGGPVGYFATLGYLVTGDTATVKYNDTDTITIGAGSSVSPVTYLALSATSAKGLIKGSDRANSLSLMLRRELSSRWYASGNYTAGLSDAVADHALNVGVGYAF